MQSKRELIQRRIEIKQEILRRRLRERHAAPGGLYAFMRHFWHVLEPKTPFVDGWAIEAICEHLEAVTDGKITRLLVNVSPGFSKSLITNVFWPAWEWGPRGLTHLRSIAFSYAAHLTERDNGKFRDLICSRDYRDLYGDVFNVSSDAVVKVVNDQTGWRLRSSVGGVGTGERADRVCFPADEAVLTEHGPLPIGEIVRRKMNVRVWSTDVETGATALKRITAWHRNPSSNIVKVNIASGGSVRCTPDHRIWTQRGWVGAASLRPGDVLPSLAFADTRNAARANAVSVGNRLGWRGAFENFCNIRLRKGRKITVSPALNGCWLGDHVVLRTSAAIGCAQVQVEMGPDAAVSNSVNRLMGHAKLGGKLPACTFVTGGDGSNHLCGEMRGTVAERAVSFAVRNVLGARSVLKVVKSGVGSVAVLVANLLSGRARADECRGNKLVNEYVFGAPVAADRNAWVPLVEDCCHYPARYLHFVRSALVRALNDAGNAPGSAKARNLVARETNGRAPDFVAVASVEYFGHVDETFCLTVEDFHTMYCGDVHVLSSNCLDDPHNISDGESEVIRKKTVFWFDEAMSNRLNNLEESAIVVIMQRVHEDDVSGFIIANEDYEHLMIPMEWDGRRYTTSIGWTDPRSEMGELAWPERYPERSLAKFRRNPFMWSGQYQQSPEPRGGGIFKRDWWQHEHVPLGKSPPPCEYIVASLDSAYTKNERNDPSGFTVWGVYYDGNGNPKVLMLGGWRKHLEIHGTEPERNKGEEDYAYKERCKKSWGLVEWVAHDCKRLRVDRLLIESKASGMSVAQEMERLYKNEGWGVELVDPEGDKYARAIAVVHLWADGIVHIPVDHIDPKDDTSELVPRDWAQLVVDEMSVFPNGRFRDLTDSATQALRHLRMKNLAVRRDEREIERLNKSRHKERYRPLYQT